MDLIQHFIATVDNKTLAVIIHDIICFQSMGLRAKTNFKYSKLQLIALLCAPQLIDIKNVGTV